MPIPDSQDFIAINEDQLRQFIDAESAFAALERTKQDAKDVRGSMFWRKEHGRDYLVRASNNATQTRLGTRNLATQEIYDTFSQRKSELESRIASQQEALERQRRMNLALRVGRCPKLLISILERFARQGIAEHFLTVGTHALYAYEAAAGVRIAPGALATRDLDVLFDTRKRLTFFTRLAQDDLSLIDILRKVDKTFEVMDDQRQTAVNASSFEVDVIRRMAKDGDPHPLRMSQFEDDFWAVQVGDGDAMLSSKRFSQLIVATDGTMAQMHTMAPAAFVKLKRKLSTSSSRDPLKKPKDLQQANIVQALMDSYLIEQRSR